MKLKDPTKLEHKNCLGHSKINWDKHWTTTKVIGWGGGARLAILLPVTPQVKPSIRRKKSKHFQNNPDFAKKQL